MGDAVASPAESNIYSRADDDRKICSAARSPVPGGICPLLTECQLSRRLLKTFEGCRTHSVEPEKHRHFVSSTTCGILFCPLGRTPRNGGPHEFSRRLVGPTRVEVWPALVYRGLVWADETLAWTVPASPGSLVLISRSAPREMGLSCAGWVGAMLPG